MENIISMVGVRKIAAWIDASPELFEKMRLGQCDIFYPFAGEQKISSGNLLQACNTEVTGRKAGKDRPSFDFKDELFEILKVHKVNREDADDVREAKTFANRYIFASDPIPSSMLMLEQLACFEEMGRPLRRLIVKPAAFDQPTGTK